MVTLRPIRTALFCLAVLSLCAVPAISQSGKASGTFVVDGKKLSLQNVSAVSYDTPNLGRVVSVLLSDKPVNLKTFQE